MPANEKSCGAVVFKRNKQIEYLLLHYGAGHWDYVKGQIEANESETDTVMRELKEETGIGKAHFVEGFRQRISYCYRRAGNTVFKQVIFYLVEAEESNVELSFEHIGFEWLPYDDAMRKLTFANAKKVLAKAQEFLGTKGVVKAKQT